MLTSDQNGSSKPKSCNTAAKQQKKPVPGVPFVKGDPRINRNGRPRSFDQARALAQEIAHELLVNKETGEAITRVEAILREWTDSPEPSLQKAFIEYAFGKVPDKIDATMEHKTKLFLNYAHDSDRVSKSSILPADRRTDN